MPTSQPVLKHFDMHVYRNKTTVDTAQVPASGTIEIYRAGTTVRTLVTVPDTSSDPNPVPTTVDVYTPEVLEIGDRLQAGVDVAKILVVGWVDIPNRQIGVTNDTGASITLAALSRLVQTTTRPSFFSDPVGTVSLGTAIATNPTNGRASGYVKEYKYDFIIRVSPFPARLVTDAEGAFVMRT